MKTPEIKAFAAKLIKTCLLLISTYLALTVIYIHFSNDALRHIIAKEMLESALLATLLSLAGGILLDFEIRLHENKNNT